MKKGRHRRYEEARALKRNQELDIDEIFNSLETGKGSPGDEGYSPAFEDWAEEFPGDEDPVEVDREETGSEDASSQDVVSEDGENEDAD